MKILHKGTCKKCKKECEYRDYGSMAVWVHVDSGHWYSNDPEPHDCNSHYAKD